MQKRINFEHFYSMNRTWWNGVTSAHENSRDYDRAGFLRGEKPLCPVELAELGPLVRGRRLLHLQCHFGLDTLGWARLGAQVTGLDFSEEAIDAAERLSRESGIAGRFVHADVYDATNVLGEQFEIVYTGIGALCWLSDIARWAAVVAACLEPGGILYVYEGHPMMWALEDARDDDALVIADSYFEVPEPCCEQSGETYVDAPPLPVRPTFTWNHGLGEIISAVLDTGLQIEFLHEHREVPWRALPSMEPVGPSSIRMWQLPAAQRDRVPLMYSLQARKPKA